MELGQVIGSVWSTRKQENLVGLKLLIVKPINLLNEKEQLRPYVAADFIGAGVGETVLLVSGSSARTALTNDRNVPVDATIVGIIDDREVDERFV